MYRSFIAAGILFLQASGFADELEEKIAQLETEMRSVGGQTASGNYGAKTASASSQIDGYGFFVTADFLWWKLYEGGTDLFFRQKENANHRALHGRIKRYDFDWEPGFKAGLGYLFDQDDWDLFADITGYSTHAHTHNKANFPVFFSLPGVTSSPALKVDACWHVNYYNAHLVLGRNFFVSKYLSLHPMFGLALAWIDQHQKIDRVGKEGEFIVLKSRNRFAGLGPHFGFVTHYFFNRHYSLYGNISGGLLWGDFHVREKEGEVNPHLCWYNERSSLHRMVPNVGFSLGAAWETVFAKNHAHAMIKAGYENQYWWRQNQLPLFDSASLDFERKAEDLELQGLTVEFRLDF